MPDFLIRALADMSVLRSLAISAGLFVAGACAVLLLVDVRRLAPRRVRHALPVPVRRWGLRLAQYAARRRVTVLNWLLAPVGSSSPSSAPKKGALR
ncbi:hypothetical protein ACFU96_42590 [Streptomyces sp. NPDC057620]|uniref:hypothetical protein n=1 Tax=Streptomyces sp. NPDC057620 TaxID=3346185 RepID=UPI0036829567